MKRILKKIKCSFCGCFPEKQNHAVIYDNRKSFYACHSCWSFKALWTVKKARVKLLQKRFGWPQFNPRQLEWLRNRGMDVSEIDFGLLWFEEEKKK